MVLEAGLRRKSRLRKKPHFRIYIEADFMYHIVSPSDIGNGRKMVGPTVKDCQPPIVYSAHILFMIVNED
jgi:hypothetical protein